MEEVEGWWDDGEYNYRLLKGQTGPLVYPAGFLYVFCFLRHVTNQGRDIAKGQHIFALLYITQLVLVLSIYTRVLRTTNMFKPDWKNVWSWRVAMACLCLSKRLHSIFVLRLFNDGVAMLLLYLSVGLFIRNRWNWGCLLFSCAVSVKMNVLLFAPGLLLLLLQVHKQFWRGTIISLAVCGVSQLFIGSPFLLTYPEAYLRKAFEIDRVFLYEWTVNWKLLSQDTFVSKQLSLLLLALHLGTLAYLTVLWLQSAKAILQQRLLLGKELAPDYIAYTLFVSNFVGIVFARTLHYQFYSWYFHALPLLLWSSNYSLVLRGIVLLGIEYSFNVFPATPLSSGLLQLVHWVILISIKSPKKLNMSIVADPSAYTKKNM
jgi:alpha-1,3-mannosyltransferase